MSGGFVISLIFVSLAALIMLGIGLYCLNSKTPVAFYSGEKRPAPDEITNISAWNRKHGLMWISFGLCILLGYVIMYFIGDRPAGLIPAFGTWVVPLAMMPWYHRRLEKQYRIKKDEPTP